MTSYTITYGRKVQVKPYEMLTIELTAEFDTSDRGPESAFDEVKGWVNIWLRDEKRELGAS